MAHAYDQVTQSLYGAGEYPSSGSGLYGLSMYANPMIGITVKDQKVVTYDYNGSENTLCM